MNVKLTPMMRQYMEIKEQYKDFILFYRLGDFYEMFNEDAITASEVLDITLTKRGSGNSDVPLCGVPFHSVEPYIAKMVKNGYKVAICEQAEDPKEAKGIVKREVTRLITPGTISDLQMLEADDNSYLCCLYFGKKEHKSQIDILDILSKSTDIVDMGETAVFDNLCLSYCDISTGMMNVAQFENVDKLFECIHKLNPKEIILPALDLKGNYNADDLNMLSTADTLEIINDITLISVVKFLDSKSIMMTWKDLAYFSLDNSIQRIKRILKLHNLNSLDINSNEDMICACGTLFAYIEETQKMYLSHFNSISVDNLHSAMLLDNFTRINLELINSMKRDEKRGTLYWVLNKTDTAMGARLLKSWINSPLLDINKINARLDMVEALYDDAMSRVLLKKQLSGIYDFERLVSKVVYKSITPKDLVALRLSIKNLPMIKELLKEMESPIIEEYLEGFDTLEDIYALLENSLVDEAPFSVRDGGVFKAGYNLELDELRDISINGENKLAAFEAKERERSGVKNLKVGFNRVFGYFIEVSKGNVKNVPEYYIRKQTLANAERYITPELKEIEDRILNAQDKSRALEYELYENLKSKMLEYVARIRYMAINIGYIDAINSLAEVAEVNHYVRPELTETGGIEIIDGRHPVVEHISGEERFVPNDVALDNSPDKEFLMIVTGPNMAGKSTYLRQVALISIMAQLGSFVPASSAKLCIVDRVFTRVGASDDLFSAQSTFMVEMNELASILNNATNRSLIILDEIGRGTSTYDGLSIAWAVVEYIAMNIRAKTLFATHYHELTELENLVSGVCNYYISVIEKNDEIAFLRKIERGGANKSLGIQVAKLAGVNQSIINRAKELLERLEEKDLVQNSLNLKRAEGVKLDVDNTVLEKLSDYEREIAELKPKAQLADAILGLDLNSMTPIELFMQISKLRGN